MVENGLNSRFSAGEDSVDEPNGFINQPFRYCPELGGYSRSVESLVWPFCPWRGFIDRAYLIRDLMTRDQIHMALKKGVSFEIRMADGEKYKVREPFQVAVGRTSVVVFDDKDLAHILPMLTMTGIMYLKRNGKH
jgi:hypothetical protein